MARVGRVARTAGETSGIRRDAEGLGDIVREESKELAL
jgi:hypothetical protein